MEYCMYSDEGVDDMKVGCFRASLLFSAFWDCSVPVSAVLCLRSVREVVLFVLEDLDCNLLVCDRNSSY